MIMLVLLFLRILLFMKEYSLLVNEEISVDSLDKLIKKIGYLLRLLQ